MCTSNLAKNVTKTHTGEDEDYLQESERASEDFWGTVWVTKIEVP